MVTKCLREHPDERPCRTPSHTHAPVETPGPLIFSDAAAAKVKQLIDEEGNDALKLRVFVQGGGCSGFQYGFTFDEVVNEDDTAMERNGVTLLIDSMSYQYLVGARSTTRKTSRRTVRDQESERDHDLRVRVVVLRVSLEAQNVNGAGSNAGEKKTGASGARFDSRGFCRQKRCTMPASKPRVPTPVWFDPAPHRPRRRSASG